MEKSTKILIGASILGVIGYFLYKNKINPTTTSTKTTKPASLYNKVDNPIIHPKTGKLIDIEPQKPIIPEPKVDNPIIHPKTGKLVDAETPIIPDLPPIIIDYSNINPNIGSSLVNTIVVNNPYANCKTQKEWDTIKMKGGIIPYDHCIIFEGSISGQTGGSFDMKTTKDTTLENSNAVFDNLLTFGKDYTNIINPSGYSGGSTSRGTGTNENDPYGFGGIPSA